jgi:hypothetical protein
VKKGCGRLGHSISQPVDKSPDSGLFLKHDSFVAIIEFFIKRQFFRDRVSSHVEKTGFKKFCKLYPHIAPAEPGGIFIRHCFITELYRTTYPRVVRL